MMAPVDSTEMRWFFDEPAREVDRWFASAKAVDDGRADRYLYTGLQDLGIKARLITGTVPKLETKFLMGALHRVQLSRMVIGTIEQWRKLSVDLHESATPQFAPWIEVGKLRKLRKFSCEGGRPREVGASARPDVGCGVELTRLVVNGKRHAYSFGFEAFGPSGTLLDTFGRVADYVFGELSVELTEEQSMSYPCWLYRQLLRDATA